MSDFTHCGVESMEGPAYFYGVFVEVFGKGVLLTGPSGIGKSETALGLIDRGHCFITDDVVFFRLSPCGKSIIGTCPSENLKGFLEVRGLGILDVASIFGTSSVKIEASLDFMCEFVSFSDITDIGRADRKETKLKILNTTIPKISLPTFPGRNTPLLIETMVRLYV